MKKPILFFFSFSLILLQNTYAQTWQLFPFNQLDYFASPDTSTSFNNVYEYKNDSTTIVNDTNVLHFNRFPVAEDHNNCYYITKIMLGDTLEFDSLVEWGNNYHYFFISDTATFPILALPGDSVIINCANGGSNFNRVKLTCDSLKNSTVFGITDSVKYFSLQALNGNTPVNYYNNYTYELSKTFGLLNFIPFRYWLYHPAGITLPTYAIKGLEGTTQTLGFNLPTFEDYIHYQVGEIYKWSWAYFVVGSGDESGFSRDSVMSVKYSNDTMYIYVNEASQMTTYPYNFSSTQITKTFIKQDYCDAIDKTYPHIGFGPIGSQIGSPVYIKSSLAIDSCLDTTFTASAISFLDSCQYIGESESENAFSFSTSAGLTYSLTVVSNEGSSQLLIGFKTATTSCGDYSQITGIPQLSANNNQLSVYPNPTSNQLTISSNQFSISQIQIENVLGQTVFNTNLTETGKSPLGDLGVKQTIDVSVLPQGIYFYRITNSNSQMASGKFIKE